MRVEAEGIRAAGEMVGSGSPPLLSGCLQLGNSVRKGQKPLRGPAPEAIVCPEQNHRGNPFCQQGLEEKAVFGFNKPRRDYNRICLDPNLVFETLYSDRRKTSEILGDESFVRAWLESDKQREITMLIRKEARNGDIPSLKQMVWHLGRLPIRLTHSPTTCRVLPFP